MTRAIALLASIVLPLAIAAVVAEGILEVREARRVYREAGRRFHPFIQITPTPDTLDGINADRFRGDPVLVEKPANTLRIFTLGGSTTLGVRNSFEETYPRMLQRRLQQQYPSLRIEVENAGVDWFTTAHLLANYQLRVRRFQPDLVIVMVAINDLYRSFAPPWFATGPYASDYSHYLGPQIALVGPPVGFSDSYDRSGWMLPRALAHAIHRDPSPVDFSPGNVERLRARMRAVPVTAFKSLDSFTANYDLLIRTIRADGHAVIVGTEASLYKEGLTDEEARTIWIPPVFCAENGEYPTIESMRDGMQRFNAAALAVARAHHVPVLDFAAVVSKSLTYFQDDVHLTKAGNDILARMAAIWIINNPVPPLAPPPVDPTAAGHDHTRHQP